jgi:hypothetical protein
VSLLDTLFPREVPEPSGARVVRLGISEPPTHTEEQRAKWRNAYQERRECILKRRKARGWK